MGEPHKVSLDEYYPNRARQPVLDLQLNDHVSNDESLVIEERQQEASKMVVELSWYAHT